MIKVTADGDATGAVFDDMTGIETITAVANGNATIKITLTSTAASTQAFTIDATGLTGGTAAMTFIASDAEVDGALTIKGSAGGRYNHNR